MPAQLQRRLSLFLIVVALIAAALFGHWLLVGRHHVETDNAYVQGEITRLSSQLSARIDEVLVQDNQHVEKGQLLVRLDKRDFTLAVERARAAVATREAELAQARTRLEQQASLIAAKQADVAASQATLGRTQIDLSRAQALRKPGFISEERVTTLSADANVARSQMSKAQADLQAQRIQIDSLTTDIQRLEALLASARTDLQQAEVNLSRTDIHAPVAGLAGNRAARSGQYVQVGSHLLALVPDHRSESVV